jgi:hypothetical protein
MKFVNAKYSVLFAGFLMVVLQAVPAHAGILVEPYIGYGLGNSKVAFAGGAEAKSDTYGSVLGARLGYQALLLFAAFDGSVGMGTIKAANSASTDADYSDTKLFALVGARLPLVRAYAGYGFINNVTEKSTPNEKLQGSAIKLGVGFTGLPFIAINFEYIASTYDKIDLGGGAGMQSKSDAGISDLTANQYMLTVSLPLDF